MRPRQRAWSDDDEMVTRDGRVTFNPLQQRCEGFDPPAVPTPVEEGDSGTTDPRGITTE